MKITHIYDSGKAQNGVTNVMTLLADLQRSDGHTVTLVSTGQSPCTSFQEQIIVPGRIFGGAPYSSPTFWGLWPKNKRQELSEALEESDIVWAHNPLTLPALSLFHKNGGKEQKRILHLHTAYNLYAAPLGYLGIPGAWAKYWVQRSVDWATTCVCPSQWQADNLEKWGIRFKTKPVVAPAPIDEFWFKKREGETIPETSRTIAVVGRISEGQKRSVSLLRTLSGEVLASDLSLVFVGSGPEKDLEKLRLAAKETGISDKLVVTIWLDKEGVRRHLVGARLVVFDSVADTQCLGFDEAIGLGCKIAVRAGTAMHERVPVYDAGVQCRRVQTYASEQELCSIVHQCTLGSPNIGRERARANAQERNAEYTNAFRSLWLSS